jgi:hypothetical protein
MGTLFNAHLFRQRSVGEREEVKIKMFGPDGSPLDLAAGGGDGGAPDVPTFFWGQHAEFNVPDTVPQRVNFGTSNPSYFGGFDIDPSMIGNGGIPEIALEKGPYLIRLLPDWNFPIGTPDSGFAQAALVLVDSAGEDFNPSFVYTFHQYSEPVQDVPAMLQMVYVPEDGMHIEMEIAASANGPAPNFGGRVEIVKP